VQFNSLTFFLTLFPILLAHRWLTPRHAVASKIVVLLYSWFFYAAWSPPFLLLLLASTVVDWAVAIGMEEYPARRKRLIYASVLSNLTMLGFFKYYGFLARSLATLADVSLPELAVVLPVGISFYTFQTLSYTIDVYRGEIPARRSFLDVALFIAYFPQLVAGPILRARDFLPELEAGPRFDRERLADGTFFVLFGLCLKCVLADNLAPRVEQLFDAWRTNGAAENWAAGMLFGAQIYADFAGYSLIALGLARAMGYHIQFNFNAPFGAASVTEFWRRWHLSLSSWLRDYLYIPLGGNRIGPVRTYVNLMLTMLLGGLWHGAAFLFVLWGGIHGLILCVERLSGVGEHSARSLPRAVFTYLIITLTWLPFRSGTLEQCAGMLRGAFTHARDIDSGLVRDFAIGAAVFVAHRLSRDREVYQAILSRPLARVGAIALLAVVLYYGSGPQREFIYFRF
jgi:alginate O-acetyltransferase complex protein AlgI